MYPLYGWSVLCRRTKNAASSKSSKTDGRSLLGNSRTLRDVTENGPAADKSTAADADDASKTDNGSAVVATGFAVIADYTDKVTANDFFTPGRVFAVRVKHSHFPGFRTIFTARCYA